MNLEQEIKKILDNNTQKSIIGWAIEDDDIFEVAKKFNELAKQYAIEMCKEYLELIVTEATPLYPSPSSKVKEAILRQAELPEQLREKQNDN